MIQPWKRVRSTPQGDYRIFQIRSDVKVSPRNGVEHDFYVIDCVDWVNVIAVTRARELVMVEQYRHGSESVELEIPGGMIDPEDLSPEAAGQRELQEETGYSGNCRGIIGSVHPNPAIMSNRCYTVVFDECDERHPTNWDHTEEIALHLVPLGEVENLLRGGKIRHCLVVAALFHYEMWRKQGGDHGTGRLDV